MDRVELSFALRLRRNIGSKTVTNRRWRAICCRDRGEQERTAIWTCKDCACNPVIWDVFKGRISFGPTRSS